jgi:CMP/dCMP kinase
VVFPTATLKVFLTASSEARAARRTNQLISKGLTAKLQDVLQELQVRDARDSNRPIAPLKHYPDAKLLVTDNLSADQAARQIVEWFQ